ncbi:MAG: hypothetical protein ACK4YF_00680 [Exilispira sp.]
MKREKITKLLDFLFPEESGKIVAIVVIIIIIILSSVFTFVIVKKIKKPSTIGEDNLNKQLNIIENIELIEPIFSTEQNIELNIFNFKKEQIDEDYYYELLKYHEFQDFTNFYFNLSIYNKIVEKFLND